MPRLQESAGRFSLTIPQEIVHEKKWQRGQELVISYNERGNLEIREIKK
jgi:hypothetical protein